MGREFRHPHRCGYIVSHAQMFVFYDVSCCVRVTGRTRIILLLVPIPSVLLVCGTPHLESTGREVCGVELVAAKSEEAVQSDAEPWPVGPDGSGVPSSHPSNTA